VIALSGGNAWGQAIAKSEAADSTLASTAPLPFIIPRPADESIPWNSVDAWGQFRGRQLSIAPELTLDSFLVAHRRRGDASTLFKGVAPTLAGAVGITPVFGFSVGVMQLGAPRVSLGLTAFRGAGWILEDFADADVQLGLSYPAVGVGWLFEPAAAWVRASVPGLRCTIQDTFTVNLRPLGVTVWIGDRSALSLASQIDLGVMF